MKKALLIYLLTSALISCQNYDVRTELIGEPLPEKKADYQKRIIGQLSGKYELADQRLLSSRWSKAERKVAKKYLMELIATLDLEPQENSYTSPNHHPAIDILFEPYRGANIYGILPATKTSDEYVVLGAHYDAGKRRAPGANDNATGVALIYSVVRELAKAQNRERNIILVFFDQEEEEQIGSKAFVKLIQEKQWNIHSIHCFDMVGWDSDGDRAMEAFSASDSLLNSYQVAAEARGIPLKQIRINPIGYDKGSTDYDAFVPFGYNAIGAGECYYHRDSTPYKDSPEDTFETVNFDYLLSCSDLIEDIIRVMLAS